MPLTLRKHFSKIKKIQLNIIKLTLGVPQCYHSPALIFILFINYIVNVINYSKILLLSDDVKLFKPIQTSSDVINLQSDIDIFVRWCIDNGIKLNINKCSMMTFKFKNKFYI